MEKTKLTRRDFLKVSAAAGGGLVIGFSLAGCDKDKQPHAGKKEDPNVKAAETTTTQFTPNAWLTVGSDDRVTIRVGSSEMGQGTLTGIAMLIAEELEADWSHVHAEHAPADKAFTNPLLGRQHTGGSTAIRGFWNIVRKAGAMGREMLVQAAARQWGVDSGDCRAFKGVVSHEASGRKLRYGQLAAAAAKLRAPASILLKEPDEFRLVGQSIPRLDTPVKVNGKAVFGMDVQLDGMLTAMVVRCPVMDGKVKRFDASKTLKVPGVRHVKPVSAGVAVIADHFWAAKKGRDLLVVEWDTAGNEKLDSAAIKAQFKAAVNKGLVERNDGDVSKAISSAARSLDAVYTVPYQAHVCMEPMNATADVRKDRCDVYAPTQGQTSTQDTAMRVTGLPRSKVKVHTTFLGGGFGRRSEQDFIADAVECSKIVGKPVKVVWTREDDVMHDQYRPDWSSTEGARNIPYDIANQHVTYAMSNTPVPVGFWRSVGSSQNAFITECFFDELARLAGTDPVKARLKLMGKHPRHAGVVKLAASKAGWGRKLPAGHAQGIAVAEAFGSYVAQVAEVSIDRGKIRVHCITCAIDCGMVVNPDSIRAQMEGGIVYGLTATLKGAVTIGKGQVEQRNFTDYPLLSLDECPDIDVHIVDSQEAPGGVGEPGVPPTAPAVANAVLVLTGKPVRSLPIRLRS